MAFQYTERVRDFMGRGIVVGNYTFTSVTTGLIQTGFKQARHATFCSNISATPVTYANSSGNVNVTGASGDAGTYEVYGE